MNVRHRILAFVLLSLVSTKAIAGIPVEGRVLGPDGKGLAGARVEIRPVLRVYEQGVRDLEAQGEPVPVAKAVTQPGGWYRIEAPREGIWRVVIAAKGFVTMDSTPMALIEETSLQDSSLKPDDGLLVRIESADGKPVAGARVAAETGARSPWSSWQPVRRAGVSGADGTLRLPRSGEETLRLTALATGYAPGRADDVDRGSLTLRLEPSRRWRIRTYDDKPVADALVRDAASLLPVGRTDGKGMLPVDAPAGTWELRVDTRDGRIAPFPVPEVPKTAPQKTIRTLILPPLVPLSGRVVDHMDGRPVPGALVAPGADPAAWVRADASGTFRLPWTSNTWAWLQVDRTGYFHERGSFFLEPGKVPTPAIVLKPSGSLAGIAVDERGQPVSGAEIRAFLEGEALHHVRSSAQGRFRLPHLHPGATYELMAVAPGLAPARESVTLLETSRADLRLVLGRSLTTHGRIVDEAGEPVAGAKVELVRNLSAEVRSRLAERISVEDGLYRAETGNEGGFEIPGLPAGWFDLEVRGSGFVPLTLRGIQLESEMKTDLGTVTLRQGAALAGRVTGPAGEPIPEAQVWVVPDDETEDRIWRAFLAAGPAAVTGPDGRFVLSGLDSGSMPVMDVCRPGYLTTTLWLKELADPVEVALQPAGRLAGRVVDPDGEPVAGAYVGTKISGEDPGHMFPRERPCPWHISLRQDETDAEGRFTLEPLAEGTFELWALAPGHLRAELDGWKVKPGQESAEPTLVLRRGALLTGRVLTAEGAPVAGASVEASGTRGYTEGRTDGDGVFRMSGAEPGEHSVSASHPKHGHGRRAIEIRPGENRLDLTLEPREQRELRGRVFGPDSEPLEGALVEIINNPFGNASAYTRKDGSFTLSIPQTEKFELLASKRGYSPARLDDWSVVGASEGLELRLERMSGLSGRILGVAPEDLPGVEVTASNEYIFERPGFVDPEGIYRILELSPGSWEVTARLGSRLVEAQAAIHPGEETILNLSLPIMNSVSGRVVGAKGEPIPGALVKLTSTTAEEGAGTGADGSFSIDARDGTYVLVAKAEGYSVTRLEEPVTVAGAPVDGLEIRLAQGASVSGRILGLRPGVDDSVNVWAQVGQFRHFGDVEDGGYLIDSLAPGEWQVTAQYGVNKVTRSVTVIPGQEAVALDLPLSPGNLTLSGRVAAYRSLKGGSVQLQRIDDPELKAYDGLDDGAAFRISHLPPGRYLLTLQESNVRTLSTQEIDLTADLELVIQVGEQP